MPIAGPWIAAATIPDSNCDSNAENGDGLCKIGAGIDGVATVLLVIDGAVQVAGTLIGL